MPRSKIRVPDESAEKRHNWGVADPEGQVVRMCGATCGRPRLLASNPMAWMISVDGFIVDARTMPPEVQAEARRRGPIPDLPGPMGKDGGETAGGGERR